MIRKPTVVTFTPTGPETPASVAAMEVVIDGSTGWQSVIPRLSKLGKGAQTLLQECLGALPGNGINAFRVGDVIDVFTTRVRATDALRNRVPGPEVVSEKEGDSAIARLIRTVQPESWQGLLDCVEKGIARQDYQKRTREGMQRLLQELRLYAESDEELPSWAELARQLGAPKATLWEHLKRLGSLVQGCQNKDERASPWIILRTWKRSARPRSRPSSTIVPDRPRLPLRNNVPPGRGTLFVPRSPNH